MRFSFCGDNLGAARQIAAAQCGRSYANARTLKDFYMAGGWKSWLRGIGRGLLRRRLPPAPGRFSVNRKSSLHGFINLSPAPPWPEYPLYLPRRFEAIPRPPLVVWIHGLRPDPVASA